MDRLWSKRFVLLTTGMLFLYTGFYSLIPVMPLYIRHQGGNEWDVGLIIGMFTLSAVLFRPFVGGLIDRLGRRPFIIGGIVFFVLFMLMYNWIAGIAGLIVLRFLHGASWAFSNSALGTAITDEIPSSRRGEGMGWYGISMTLAMAVGPLIGSLFVKNQSFSLMFHVAALISFGSLLLVAFSPTPYQPRKGKAILPDEKPKWSVMFTIFLMSISFGGITTFLPLFAESLDISSSAFFLVYAITLTLIRPIAGKITDRKGEPFVIVPALLFIVLALINLSVVHGLAGILCSAVLYAVGFGSAQPALQAAALRVTHPDRKGAANALFFTSFDLGIGLGSIALGWISQSMGYRTLFLSSALSVGISALVFTIFVRRLLRTEEIVRSLST
ncbi:MFS transporter [Cohnella sp. AR92]|uniref:MFS transporter n=1 Tax=Cohnella sp. AR92 TaxID=648716 RepID=UPI000F8E643C|nr:MFS transporter [Cohnella sp. AR92]RUS45567.1 MFS transporter [Cohnella sp. AR92]